MLFSSVKRIIVSSYTVFKQGQHRLFFLCWFLLEAAYIFLHAVSLWESHNCSYRLFFFENCVIVSFMPFSPGNRIITSFMLFSMKTTYLFLHAIFCWKLHDCFFYAVFYRKPHDWFFYAVFYWKQHNSHCLCCFLVKTAYSASFIPYAVSCLMPSSEFSTLPHNLLFHVSLQAIFRIHSRLCLFQAIGNLEFSFQESIILLEQLYQNWNNVAAHLRLADRAKAFKCHMKEVILFLLIFKAFSKSKFKITFSLGWALSIKQRKSCEAISAPLLVPTPTCRFPYHAWRDSKTWYPAIHSFSPKASTKPSTRTNHIPQNSSWYVMSCCIVSSPFCPASFLSDFWLICIGCV